MTKSTEMQRRTALITGSGRNIGRSIALKLAVSGVNIVLNGSSDRAACESVAGEIRATGVEVLIAMGDVGSRDQVRSIAEQSIKHFGAIDILVNNAAIRPSFDLVNDDEADFTRIMNVNFLSAWWLVRACLPGMIENNWGRVINFTGMNAQQGYTGKSAVSISKHASWGLTKSIAREYAKNGITANIISPGTIVADDEHEDMQQYATLKHQHPAGKLGVPDDIGDMVSYLASDKARFVNGQLLQINGGMVV